MSVISLGLSPQIFKQVHPHDHATWEIVLNIQGNGYSMVGEKCFEYGPGTIICQPPNILHTKYSQEGFKDVYIQLTSFSLAPIAEEKGGLVFQDDEDKSFEKLILLAHRAYHEKSNNYKLLVNSLFEAMNQLLISWQNNSNEDRLIEQLKNKLIDSFSDPEFSIAGLLDQGHYCKDHLRRRFRQATGQTPVEYLTQLRLEYAKKLMSENAVLRYSIAEIGVMSGYYDSHYFSRVFKNKTGMTPMEFMNKAQHPLI